MITEIKLGVGTITFIVIVMVLIIFEKITSTIKVLEGREFHAIYEMVQVVYKELMIMGFLNMMTKYV